MTSPNINVVILFGTTLGYVSVVFLGLDATVADDVNVDATVQVSWKKQFSIFANSRSAYIRIRDSVGALKLI